MRRLAVVLAFLLAAPLFAQRLPQTVIPSNYRLHFVPDLVTETFSANETITVDVKTPTSTVVLNALEIEFDEVTITAGGKTQTARVTVAPEVEAATFTVDEPLPVGRASIAVRFRGKINHTLRGFYLSRTPRRKYAVTQFESTSARRAFPSFDEPAMKATYEISLVIDAGDTAISNEKMVKDEPVGGAGKHTVTFARTKKMSTYLVAMLVGDWQCSEGRADGIPIRVCSIPEKKALTKWAVAAAEAELHFYNDYYAFKYPFGKLDIIGIPDFEAGAMENAGAVTFRETSLLIDDATAAISQRRRVAEVNAHEIAHMWFGDLVTMKWWDDIWLNEGFASWISSKPVAAWKPEWNVAIESAESTRRSLALDSAATTRAIRTKAETPAQINQLFDGIAYGKTAAVLRMVESYVGERSFREGIRAYVKKYAYANAEAEDFWGTMTAATRQPVDKIMPTFVTQPGAPLVTASARCDGGETLLTLAQRRIFARRAQFLAGNTQLWTIPVRVRNLDARDAEPVKLLLQQREQTFRIKGCSPHLYVNYDGMGFYRTSHAAGMVDPRSLSPSERVALLSDSWALAQIGEQDIASHLAVIERLRGDRERAVVSAISDQLETIGDRLVGEAQLPAFRKWLAGYLRPVVTELGWTPKPGETDDQKRLRAKVVALLGRGARDEEALRRAKEWTALAMRDPSVVDPTLLPVAIDLAAAVGDAALFEEMKAARAAAKTPIEFYRYQSALLSFDDPELRKQAFPLALAPEMRNQDLPGFLSGMLAEPAGRAAAWEWIKSNWPALRKNFTPWGGRTVIGAVGGFCDPKAREDVRQFFAANPVPDWDRSLASSMERIDTCIEFRTLQSQNFASWLAAHGS